MTAARILLLAGWQGHDGGDWQARWARRHGFEPVQQDDSWWPRRGDWMTRLHETLLVDDRPAVLVAQGLGCHLVAAWAAHAGPSRRVAAALLVAPTDLARPGLPPQLQGWSTRQRLDQARTTAALPFASSLLPSSDDPHSDIASSLRMAATWGSEAVAPGAAGDVGGASGLADWPAGLALLQALLRRAGLGDAAAAAQAG